MNHIIFLLLISFLGNIEVNVATSTQLTESISKFSTSFYTTAIEGQTTNIVLSPISVQTILALTYMGAVGKTANAMLNGLQLQNIGTKNTISAQMQEFIGSFQNNTSLKLANAIYVKQGYSIKPKFKATAIQAFYSVIESIDFTQSSKASATINKWVENQTNNKIKKLISPDSLDASTRMVLVNAVYFIGEWKYQFKDKETAKAPFYINAKKSVQVDMMHVEARFRYGQISDLDAKCIELPYKDSDMSMVIILPNKRTGLAELETNLKTLDIDGLSDKMTSTKVKVWMPKFKIDFKLSLKEALKKMGMSQIFADSANFSDLLNSNESVQVSDVVQKAFIDVNEKGTEAAAATAVIMRPFAAAAPPPKPIVFNADHPFTFMLKKGNDILFMGRFINSV